jgi:hypothetical protein
MFCPRGRVKRVSGIPLKALLRASILKKDISGKIHYAVLIGDYSSRESAEKDQPVVQNQCACAPYIIEK